MTAPALKIVAAPPALEQPQGDSADQLRRTRALARALARQDRVEAALREARAAVDAAFGPWAAGRRVSREQAREQLTSTGFLPQRRAWE